MPITIVGRYFRKTFASATRASNESNSLRLGSSSVTRTCTPRMRAASRASARRTSGPGLPGVGSPSVRSTMPTLYPCWTSRASVPPQAISTSSGWAPTAIKSSLSGAASVMGFIFMVGTAGIVESERFAGGPRLKSRLSQKRSHGFRHAVRMREIRQLPGQWQRFAGRPRQLPGELVFAGCRDGSLVFGAQQQDGPLDVRQPATQIGPVHQAGAIGQIADRRLIGVRGEKPPPAVVKRRERPLVAGDLQRAAEGNPREVARQQLSKAAQSPLDPTQPATGKSPQQNGPLDALRMVRQSGQCDQAAKGRGEDAESGIVLSVGDGQ